MSGSRAYADWIAVDWGTTHLRAWALGPDGAVRSAAQSGDGRAVLSPDGFEPALLDLVQDWLGSDATPVLACGMVGAAGGWHMVPCVAVPARPGALVPVLAPTPRDPRLAVWIVPGLSQESPPDVMHGEETQIAGFLAAEPSFDGVLCLPGSHTKWVRISAGEVVSFQTCMTGEIFGLLARHSVLSDAVDAPTLEDAAFAEAVSDTLSRPERLAQRLFAIRAGAVLHAVAPATGRARLSGALIGAELAATRPYWLGQQVVVAGAPDLTALYGAALSAQGCAVRTCDAAPLVLAGLAQFHAAQGAATP